MATHPHTDPALQSLQLLRERFWAQHLHLSDEQREQLWTERSAMLANLVSSFDDNPHYARHVPRTLSFGGSTVAPQFPSLQIPQSMGRSASHQSIQSAPAASLARSFSSHSATDEASPFSIMSDWQSSNQEPFSAYRMSDGADPAYSLNPTFQYAFESPSSLPILSAAPHVLAQQDLTQLSVQENVPYGWSSSYDGSSGVNTPTTGELTVPSTVASSDMSRRSSTLSAFQNIHVDSTPLHVFDFIDSVNDTVDSGLSVERSASFGFAESSNCSPFPFSSSFRGDGSSSTHFLSRRSAPRVQTKSDLVEDMKRSTSSQSDSSSTSAQSRVSQRRQETLAQSSRPIAPKVAKSNVAEMTPKTSSHKMNLVPTQDGSSKNVAVITKVPAQKSYVRPRHPKILCPHCDKCPDGFRGEHELRRHVDSKHAKVRKVWICVDASPNETFLASCKQCRNQKQYGAYYNAAAHLRRAHFHPRKRGRKSRNDSEKRGGKGGGNDPPMEELKKWMKEIEVLASEREIEDVSDDSEESDIVPPVSENVSVNPTSNPTDMATVGFSYLDQTPPINAYDGGYDDYSPGPALDGLSYAYQPTTDTTMTYPATTMMDYDPQQQFDAGSAGTYPFDMS